MRPPSLHTISFDWDAPEAADARTIRLEVFVREQQVPAELEMDATDAIARHVLACDATGTPLGTGRLYEDPGQPGRARIGRMAVLRSGRGRGVGRAILEALVDEGVRRGFRDFVLDAQVRAIPFYERCGFEVCGPLHLDAGIEHRLMRMSVEEEKA